VELLGLGCEIFRHLVPFGAHILALKVLKAQAAYSQRGNSSSITAAVGVLSRSVPNLKGEGGMIFHDTRQDRPAVSQIY
jgi:hypothetical protein